MRHSPCSKVYHDFEKISIDVAGCQGLDSRMFPLPWRHLTCIDFDHVGLSVYDMAYILPMCVSAHKLTLCTVATMGPFMPRIKPVRLPVVELDWNGINVDSASIFEPLLLPRLTSLRLRDSCGPSLFNLSKRSSFALTSLYLMSVQLHHVLPDFFNFLRTMPSLVSLDVCMSISVSNELLEFLTYDTDRPVLPHLERVFLGDHAKCMLFMADPGWRTKIYEESVMLAMVESRWGTTPLTRMHIHTTRNNAGKASTSLARRVILDRVIELMEAGLNFSYECE